MWLKIVLLVVLASLLFTGACNRIFQEQDLESTVVSEGQNSWKAFSQLEEDLALLEGAGYTSVCLFDLNGISHHPDRDLYIELLREYVGRNWDIALYIQNVDPATALNLVDNIGASSVILYEEEILQAFSGSGIKTWWWSGAAYPVNDLDRPMYRGWSDLRKEEVRAEIADWIVGKVPEQIDGGLSLDYIRWNAVGDGREAYMVTDLVQRVRDQWQGPLSAAVYPYLGKSPRHGGALSVGQQWNLWLENDLVDFAYPMAYESEDLPAFIEEWKLYAKDKIVPCLSVENYH